MGAKGIVATTAAMSVLLQEGIGDTIRASLTPLPNGDRTEEVIVCQQILQSLGTAQLHSAGHGLSRLRAHHQHVLPGDGRRDPDLPARADAGVEGVASRRGGDEGRRDGLRGERTGRIEARQHRHLAAGHIRRARRAGVRGRPAGDDAARRRIVAEFIEILDDYVATRYGREVGAVR